MCVMCVCVEYVCYVCALCVCVEFVCYVCALCVCRGFQIGACVCVWQMFETRKHLPHTHTRTNLKTSTAPFIIRSYLSRSRETPITPTLHISLTPDILFLRH